MKILIALMMTFSISSFADQSAGAVDCNGERTPKETCADLQKIEGTDGLCYDKEADMPEGVKAAGSVKN